MNQEKPSKLIVTYDGENGNEARQLAAHLKVPCTGCVTQLPVGQLRLNLSEAGLTFTDGELTLQGDFSTMLPRLKENNLRSEMLVKAAKLKSFEGIPTVVDATAGMGEDSLLLAAAGFRVILFERDPIIAALLRDSLKRAAKDPALCEFVSRMELREENSTEGMQKLPQPPEVIYLDPMFPERQKSASVKKKFQLLQQLERPCMDEEELLHAVFSAAPRKIVVKRPLKGPFLCGIKPAFSLQGKAIRYDCLLPAGMKTESI